MESIPSGRGDPGQAALARGGPGRGPVRAPAPSEATHPIVTRRSVLARVQTDEACHRLAAHWPAHRFPTVAVDSRGDEAQELAVVSMTGTGWFTAALEAAVLEGRGEAAVHSAKDLPTEMPPGLAVAAYLPRADPRDVLVTVGGQPWRALPSGARVGTGSPRRAFQLRALRPDWEVVPLRGNVDTRLGHVAEGRLEAVCVALAGLRRLGREATAQPLDPEWECVPAPAQGAIAIQARADSPMAELAAAVGDPVTQACVVAERLVLQGLGGGCRLPLGVLARPLGPEAVRLVGILGLPGRPVRRAARDGGLADLGRMAAELVEALR